jgi:ATP-dependent phosphoenolpyruvate carboxykinase
MKLEYTRRIIDAIHDGSLLEAEYELTPIFNLAVPTKVKSVPTEVLHPENLVSKVLTIFVKSITMQLDVDLHCML